MRGKSSDGGDQARAVGPVCARPGSQRDRARSRERHMGEGSDAVQLARRLGRAVMEGAACDEGRRGGALVQAAGGSRAQAPSSYGA